ncbi:hypothetical protein ACLI09_01835 [Flavobacterium sp. RHBU_24]|uniref:hypothetical protein n=1 Tax=Flavobacterium sp. RHBU_24 TaxID=3391185 RepID=UPI0039847F08
MSFNGDAAMIVENVERIPMLMFTEITWAMYLRTVAALLFIYYMILILKFYLPQFSASLRGTSAGAVAQGSFNPAGAHAERLTEADARLASSGSFTAPETGNDYDVIEEIVDRVKSSLQYASETTMEPNDVLSSFRTILQDYPSLGRSTFRPSINEFIASESAQHGYLTITQDTVEPLWPTK